MHENPILSSEIGHEENEQGEADIKPENADGASMEDDTNEEGKTKEEDGKRDGFGDKRLEIEAYREKYASDLELGEGFGIKECEAKEKALEAESKENSGEAETIKVKEAQDDFIEAAGSMNMSQLDKESATLPVGVLKLMIESCQREISLAKANYLLELEECFNAGGDDRKEKIEKFINEEHPNRVDAIIKLETTAGLINERIKILEKKAAEEEENAQTSQEEFFKEEPEAGLPKEGKSLGGKAWGGVKKAANLLGWAGIVSAFGLSRIFSWKKLDELMEKWTKKKLDPKLKSGGKESK